MNASSKTIFLKGKKSRASKKAKPSTSANEVAGWCTLTVQTLHEIHTHTAILLLVKKDSNGIGSETAYELTDTHTHKTNAEQCAFHVPLIKIEMQHDNNFVLFGN